MEGGNEAVKDQDKEKRHRVKSENQTAGGWWAPAAVPTSPSFFFILSLSLFLSSLLPCPSHNQDFDFDKSFVALLLACVWSA